jgi:thioesterase domain-containing protein
VVFDIAQRLLENGRAIGSLTILDSEVPESRCEYNNTEAIMAWIEIFEQILERPLDVGRGDLDLLNEPAQRKLLHKRLVSEGLVPPRTDPGILQGPLRTFAMSLRTHYRPDKVYPGPVQLILVDNPKLDQDANRRSQECIVDGWKQWAPNLVCTCAPGNHMSVLKPPHVQTVARLLQNAMSDIRKKAAVKGAGS